ncbi:uncharacterized protein LOC110823675 [Carica papaya]|uniref:uncharacterized protein LOC110823675 n=1 Tax=Carica papaya TaxID=3649 RepID=UPI000B8CF6DD|nr:uncharacterized protein LOC110823675 [Carica papaya]
MATSGTTPALQFNGENYHMWAIKMRAHLKALGLWDVIIDDSEPTPLQETATLNQIKRHEEEKTKKPKALVYLFSAVSDRVFSRIMNYESPKEAWEKLKEEFDRGDRSKKIKLLRLKSEFALFRMQENESVRDYASKLSDIVNKMRLLGEDFPESRVVEQILISLPLKFESKISALEEHADIDKISSAELINKLQIQEQRVNMHARVPIEGALFSSQGKKAIQCNFCKRVGHKEKFCRQKQKLEAAQSKQELQHINITEISSEQSNTILVTSSELTVEDDSLWVVDSGCTSHMCKNEAMFVSLDKSATGQVRLENGMLETIKGKGNIAIETKEGKKFITDVNFVPTLSQNLLSVNQMTDQGYSVGFKDNCRRIYDPEDRLIAFI